MYLYRLASARVLMRVARNGKISHRVSRCDWHRIVHQLTICPHTSGPLVHTQAHNNSQCHYHHEGWGMRGLWGGGGLSWGEVELAGDCTRSPLYCAVRSHVAEISRGQSLNWTKHNLTSLLIRKGWKLSLLESLISKFFLWAPFSFIWNAFPHLTLH